MLFSCSKNKTFTDNKLLVKKEGDWVLIKNSNEIFQVISIENNLITILKKYPTSNSNIQTNVFHDYDMNDVELLNCIFTEDSLSILNVERDSLPILKIFKGDHVRYQDSILDEFFAFEKIQILRPSISNHYSVSLKSLEGTLKNSTFNCTGTNKIFNFQDIMNVTKSVKRKYFKKRLLKFPYKSTLTWINDRGEVQKGLTLTPQMESDSLTIMQFSNSGKMIRFNVLPENLNIVENSMPSIQDTIRMLIEKSWKVPDAMFDFETKECGKLLLQENQIFLLNNKSRSNDIQYFSFDNGININKQYTSFAKKVKMGYFGKWLLIDNCLVLQLNGEGSYFDEKTQSYSRNKWNYNLELEIIELSEKEFKLKTKKIISINDK